MSTGMTEERRSQRQSTTDSPVLLITSDAIGHGSDELGRTLMRSFLHALCEVHPQPEKIILMNSGVKLAVEGSQVLEELGLLEGKGIQILACGTCLGYYEVKDKLAVGQVSNMYDIASLLLGASRVVDF